MQPSASQDLAFLQARVAELERRLSEQSAELEKARAARDSEDGLLREALSSVAEGIIVCSAEGRILHFNDAATMFCGAGRTELPPSQWSEWYGLHYPDDRGLIPAAELPLARALRGEHVERFELCVRKDGEPLRFWLEANARPIYASDGALRGAVVVFRDIAERRLREQELELRLHAEAERLAAEEQRLKQGRMLRLLLDYLDIVVWAVDAQGIFTFQEGKGLAAAGLVPRQFIGKSVLDIYGVEGAGGILRAMKGEAYHSPGSEIHGVIWENWAIPIRDDEGNLAGAMGLAMNVTEWQKTRAELEAKLAVIERQQEVIRNLETPVIQVWDKVVTLPMVGVVDSRRAARVMDDLLASITRTQAEFAILDLTGVDLVDTSTACHLIRMIEAVRLLGAEGIITGIRPNVAQTVVSLGLDMSRVITLATLRDGLSLCIRRLSPRKAGSPRAHVR